MPDEVVDAAGRRRAVLDPGAGGARGSRGRHRHRARRCSRSWPTPTARPGWSVMANATSSCFAAIYTGDEAARAMFGGGRPGIHAGMLGPMGQATASTTATWCRRPLPVRQRLRATPTGSAPASWRWRDGEPARERARPAGHAGGVPAPGRTSRSPATGTCSAWPAPAASTTGSTTPRARRVLVPAARARRRSAAVRGYAIGLFALTAAGHAGFALGVGRRALDEVLDIARSKQRLGAEPIADQQLFQHDFAMHDAAMRAARAYTYEAFAEAEAAVRGRRDGHQRAAAAHAPGHDLRHPRRGRRRPLRLHVGRLERPAQPERGAALLPRHLGRHPAPVRRQQHAHRLHRRPCSPRSATPDRPDPIHARRSTQRTRGNRPHVRRDLGEKSAVTVSTRDAQQTGKGLAVWLAGGAWPEGADPEVLDISAPDSNGMSSETLLFDAVWTEDGERVHHAAGGPGRARHRRRAGVPELRLRDRSSG